MLITNNQTKNELLGFGTNSDQNSITPWCPQYCFQALTWPLSSNHERGITHLSLNIQTGKLNISRLNCDYLAAILLTLRLKTIFNQDAHQNHLSFCKQRLPEPWLPMRKDILTQKLQVYGIGILLKLARSSWCTSS